MLIQIFGFNRKYSVLKHFRLTIRGFRIFMHYKFVNVYLFQPYRVLCLVCRARKAWA
jgi:hypothetical protein